MRLWNNCALDDAWRIKLSFYTNSEYLKQRVVVVYFPFAATLCHVVLHLRQKQNTEKKKKQKTNRSSRTLSLKLKIMLDMFSRTAICRFRRCHCVSVMEQPKWVLPEENFTLIARNGVFVCLHKNHRFCCTAKQITTTSNNRSIY